MNKIIFEDEAHPLDFFRDCLGMLGVNLKKKGLSSSCFENCLQFTVVVHGPLPENFESSCLKEWRRIGSAGWQRVMSDDITFEWDSSEHGGRIYSLPGLSGALELVTEYTPPPKTIDLAGELPDSDALEVDPKTPYITAGNLLAKDWTYVDLETDKRNQTLYRIGGDYFCWKGSYYEPMTPDAVRQYLYQRLSDAVRADDGTSFNPDQGKVTKIEDALRSRAFQDGDTGVDFWLDGDGNCNLISLENGLLDPVSREIHRHTPLFFTRCSLPVAYHHSGPEPHEWLKFLGSIWPDDPDSVRLLRQWFGYLLTNRTDHHKVLLLVGPPRSGKGTISTVLTNLLGGANVAGPTLSDFASQFGLAQLIGKKAAIVGDARFAGRQDQMAQVASRLLAISGEDTLTVDRKHVAPWIGRIGARLVICSNELPRLSDSSGALASRFSILQMRHSFLGAEDRGLAKRLLSELPAILRWALDGLDDLDDMGHFVQPESSIEAKQDLNAITSPVADFVSERCEVIKDASVLCDELFMAWRQWCELQGREHSGTLQIFGRDLKSAFPAVATQQIRAGVLRGKREFHGIRLLEPAF